MPPLVLVAVAWVAGLTAAHHWLTPLDTEPILLLIPAALALAGAVLFHKDDKIRLGAILALALLLGAWRYLLAVPDFDEPNFVAHYNDQGWVTVEGVVCGYPDVRDTWTNLNLDAEWLEIDGKRQQVYGRVLVRAPRYPEPHYGDRLRVSGLLETPPELEGFSYRDYLARKGLYSLISRPQVEHVASGEGSPFWTAIYAVKDRARDVIARLVPDPEASLMQGILLGIETGISDDLYDDFNATGTSHWTLAI